MRWIGWAGLGTVVMVWLGCAAPRYGAVDDALLVRRLASLKPVKLRADLAGLDPGERRLLERLVRIGELVDALYLEQLHPRNREWFGGLRRQVEADPSPVNRRLLDYFWICKGPYDVLGRYEPFLCVEGRPVPPMPPGRNFYPSDLTAAAFDAWVETLPPGQAELARSDFSVIRRDASGRLQAVPYSEAFRRWLVPLAAELEAAARLARPELARFLRARARAFRTNDYEESEALWIALHGRRTPAEGHLEITIGPYENYADELLKRKAAFELYAGVLRPDVSARLATYGRYVHRMDDHLWGLYERYRRAGAEVAPGRRLPAGEPGPRWEPPGARVTLVAVDLVYGAGQANEGYQTLAYNLPNVAAWREKYGTKKVILLNLIEGKFEHILRPIAALALVPEDLPYVTAGLFTDNTVRHEVAHGIGPGTLRVDGRRTTVRERLGKYHSPFEEAKAEIVGLLFGYWLHDQGVIGDREWPRRMAVTYTASIFRTLRFGATSDHARGKLFELTRLLENRGIEVVDGRFRVHPARFRRAVERLAVELLDLQVRGDAARAGALLEGLREPPALQQLLKRIAAAGIPVDLRVHYPFGPPYGVLSP